MDLFIAINTYSQFPEVVIVCSTSDSCIIPQLDRIFSIHGIPHVVRTDSGPPFTSEEIKEYMSENGIDHCRITPLWPQANSEAETIEQRHIAQQELHQQNCSSIEKFKTKFHNFRLGIPTNCLILVQR